jgi:hypothetical protein
MYTSIAMLALSSLLGAIPQAKEPVWQSDYNRAFKRGKEEKRPLAIFVGSGPKGYDKVAEDGKLTRKMRELLTEKYICIYVDTTNEAGREWARALRLDTGLIIGDRTGGFQAFRHAGKLPARDLTRYLERFADPTVVVEETTTHTSPRASYYPSQEGVRSGRFTRSC